MADWKQCGLLNLLDLTGLVGLEGLVSALLWDDSSQRTSSHSLKRSNAIPQVWEKSPSGTWNGTEILCRVGI